MDCLYLLLHLNVRHGFNFSNHLQVNHLLSHGHVIILGSFTAANDPCDKMRVIGTGLSTAKININYTCIGELSKVNAQVSLFHRCQPVALMTERTITKIKSAPALRPLIER